ncbi:hypothetical protein M2375_000007 [Comamonas sp. BIGb0152]|nr:hypothetical protein [Comamonas sp. BIGb0152]
MLTFCAATVRVLNCCTSLKGSTVPDGVVTLNCVAPNGTSDSNSFSAKPAFTLMGDVGGTSNTLGSRQGMRAWATFRLNAAASAANRWRA